MDAGELKDWLGREESAGAGWDKDDGSGETIGHERYNKNQHWKCKAYDKLTFSKWS